MTSNEPKYTDDCPHCEKPMKLIAITVDSTKELPVKTRKYRCQDCGFLIQEKL